MLVLRRHIWNMCMYMYVYEHSFAELKCSELHYVLCVISFISLLITRISAEGCTML